MAEYRVPEVLEVKIDGETFRGRPLRATKVQEIRKRNTAYQLVGGQPVPVRDIETIGVEFFVETVTGWDGPTLDGKPWECTPDTRREFADEHPDRAAVIVAALEAMKADLREAKRKNS